MNVFFNLAILVIGFFSFSTVQASPQNIVKPAILLQLNNDSLILDETNIESVAFFLVDEVMNECNLQLKLNKDATIELNKMTSQHIGEQLTISLNGRVVSSPIIGSALGGEFIINGVTKEEGENFVEYVQK